MTREEIILLAKQCGIGYRGISEEFYTGYCDGVVLEQMYAFAKRVAERTMMNIDPSSFMSYQEGFEAGNRLAIDGFCKQLRQLHDAYSCSSDPSTLKKRDEE
jgi:hypothetical protein